MIDVVARHQLVFDEDGWRGGAAAEEVEGEADHALAVAFGEVAHRRNQGTVLGAQLGAGVGLRVLADDRAAVAAAGFLEGAGRAERAWIVGGADQDPRRGGLAEVPAHAFERGLELAVTVD